MGVDHIGSQGLFVKPADPPAGCSATFSPVLVPAVPGSGVEWSLTGRDAEREVLDRVVEAIRAGQSRALVVLGEAGVGKTALLEYLAGRAQGCQVLRAAGVESETEFAFATLQQLCAPLRDHYDSLPDPQREAPPEK